MTTEANKCLGFFGYGKKDHLSNYFSPIVIRRIEARRFKFMSVGGIIEDVVNERGWLDENMYFM